MLILSLRFVGKWQLQLSRQMELSLQGSITIPCGKLCLRLIPNMCQSSLLVEGPTVLCALLLTGKPMRRLQLRRYIMHSTTALMHWELCENWSSSDILDMKTWLLWKMSWCPSTGEVSMMSTWFMNLWIQICIRLSSPLKHLRMTIASISSSRYINQLTGLKLWIHCL